MNQKNQVIKTLEVIEKYLNNKSLVEKDLLILVNDVYNSIIEDYRKKYLKSTIKYTVEDCEDLADVIIDLSNILIVTVLRHYSLDTTSVPYEMTNERMLKMKKHISRRLLSKKDDILSNELSSCFFTFSYFQSISNAFKHRKSVLSEQNKTKSTKRKNG